MHGRFAPSPTGELHLGNLRTALLAWLFARVQGGRFVLRFEDLDRASVRPECEDAQRRDLALLGLDWDDELRQSDHLPRYEAAVAALEAAGAVYPCYCTRREIREAIAAPHGPVVAYPGTCAALSDAERRARVRAGRRAALRLRAGGVVRSFDDVLCGPTTVTVDDLVIRRADGLPAYNLVVVVDDAHQGVQQVVRADDLLEATGAQLVLADLLGLASVSYAHVPLVVGPTGTRLAKRDGAVTLTDRLALGETPAQVLRRLAVSASLVDDDAIDEVHDPRDLLAMVSIERLRTIPRPAWTFDPDAP